MGSVRIKAVVAAVGVLVLASAVQAPPARAATPAIYGFGSNYAGELGNGTTTDSLTPTAVTGLPSPVVEVSTGLQSAAAVLADGSLWEWGSNYYGQMGIGSVGGTFTTPVQVPGLSNVTHVSLNPEGGGFAVKSDGTLWSWGDNRFGELGNGNTTSSYSPAEVPSLSAIISVVSGGFYTLALRTDGTLWAWGFNADGELGDGTTTNELLPEEIISGVTQIASGGEESYAVRSDGTLWDWGSDGFGELGQGVPAGGFTDIPVRVPGLGGVTQVATDGLAAMAVVGAAKTIWSWGYNEKCGELGDGTMTDQLSPEQIGLSGVTRITMGTHFLLLGYSAAVRSDGTLWTWGCNDHGQLGSGAATAPVLTPTQVTALTGVSQFAFGDATTNIIFINTQGAYGLAVGLLPATVPNVVFDKLATARTVLQGAGLILGTVTDVVDPTCNHLGAVLSQSPAAGTRVSLGAAVNVKVGIAPSLPQRCP
jgi:alpha-tubulin suppressor-like RCC1 family protein